jgi:hypothetical protein
VIEELIGEHPLVLEEDPSRRKQKKNDSVLNLPQENSF